MTQYWLARGHKNLFLGSTKFMNFCWASHFVDWCVSHQSWTEVEKLIGEQHKINFSYQSSMKLNPF